MNEECAHRPQQSAALFLNIDKTETGHRTCVEFTIHVTDRYIYAYVDLHMYRCICPGFFTSSTVHVSTTFTYLLVGNTCFLHHRITKYIYMSDLRWCKCIAKSFSSTSLSYESEEISFTGLLFSFLLFFFFFFFSFSFPSPPSFSPLLFPLSIHPNTVDRVRMGGEGNFVLWT